MGYSHGQMLTILCCISMTCCEAAIVVVYAPAAIAVVAVIVTAALLAGLGLYVDARTSRPDLWQGTTARTNQGS
jgi:hypothetical protein